MVLKPLATSFANLNLHKKFRVPNRTELPAGKGTKRKPRPKQLVVLCLDGSGSMQGQPIKELNAGLLQFLRELRSSAILSDTVELGVIRFAEDAEVIRKMGPLKNNDETVPVVRADGPTSMGMGLQCALSIIGRSQKLNHFSSNENRTPMLIIMSDGQPTDDWEPQAWRIQKLAQEQELTVLAIGIGDAADMDMLARLCTPDLPPMRLSGLRFSKFFSWINKTLAIASESEKGDRLFLPPSSGWSD